MARLFVSLFVGLSLIVTIYVVNPFASELPPVHSNGKPALELGAKLYEVQKVNLIDPFVEKDRLNSLVVPGLLQVMDKVEVASPIEGKLAYLGDEIPLAAQLVCGAAPFLVDPTCNVASIKYQEAQSISKGDSIDVFFVEREYSRIYRRWLKGQMVAREQTLAMLDPIKAFSEKRSKYSKVEAAEAEYRAAAATEKEAKRNADRSQLLFQQKAIAEYEFNIAVLTYIRHKEEAEGKKQAVKSAKIEYEQAQLLFNLHEIRNQLPIRHAIIKEIFRDRAESVKPQDKIMELHSLDRFLVEGLVEINHYSRLKPGIPVTIEPTQEAAPLRTFPGHRAEITGVAFTKDLKNPRVVSASEDRTVMVWSREHYGAQEHFAHDEPVRSVICSPRGSDHNLIFSGCADGSIHVWDLDDPKAPSRKIPKDESAHRDAITSLAISADGKYLASGSADATIKLWKVTGEPVYTFDEKHGATNPHQGTITSLSFTPECRLVSAARDNTLRVWDLHEKGVKLHIPPTTGRGGSVHDLGVSADGRFMLFDQGETLQLLSVEDGRTINTVTNAGNTILFDTAAIFSPDSTLLLTAGAQEGKLQLWSRPTANSRAFEVRQFVADERATVTCAAFAPPSGDPSGAGLAASGTKDGYVYLWPVPTKEDVQTHKIRNVYLTTINPTLDIAHRQIRIGVEVPNQFSDRYPNGRLISNRPVTIVID